MDKVSAIDIGTNSMRLLLCTVHEGKIISKHKDLITTRMGKGLGKDKKLTQEAIARNIEALIYFGKKIKEYDANAPYIIATSALRDALNRDEFLNRAKDELGLTINVIDGKKEAELGIYGVLSEEKDIGRKVLVLDVGGGSTELVLGSQKDGIIFSESIQAGAVRMTEAYDSKKDMQEKLKELFKKTIQKLKAENINILIAIGGTATTCASIDQNMLVYDSKKVHNSIISYEKVKAMYDMLSSMEIEERYKVIGLNRERADVMPAGMAILEHVMKELNLDSVTISENDNLEGMVIEKIT